MPNNSFVFIFFAQKNEKVKQEVLALINNDEEKFDEICMAARHSVGMQLDQLDFDMINKTTLITNKFQLNRVGLKDYVTTKLSKCCPNLQVLVGDKVAANMLTRAGGMTKLSKMPASTLQIMGAEKALFKAIKSRGKTPKYGYVFNTPYVTKVIFARYVFVNNF